MARRQADHLSVLYAVTYEENDDRKSFFVGLELARTQLANGTAGWQIIHFGGGTPEGL